MWLVVLQEPAGGVGSAGRRLRLGPLAFVAPVGAITETLGSTLEAVGAAVANAEPRPRPFPLTLPVRGVARSDVDQREAARRLRRQVRQLFDNPRWLAGGLTFWWEDDEELTAFLRIGGGDLADATPGSGVSHGEWKLALESCFIRGRPGRHRQGRRLDLSDRRTGLVPRDTRGVIYSTDHSAHALPTEPLVIPGDTASVLLTRNRPAASSSAGPTRGIRTLFRQVAAQDGDVASYLPDRTVLGDTMRAYLDVDDVGQVRVWDLTNATEDLDPASNTAARDTTPELYGWERVFGDVLDADAQLAVDNGLCRLVWLGSSPDEGLALEWWDDALGRYRREGRLAGAADVREVRLVEVGPERAVIEWRGGSRALRVILQRGWYAPRLEAFDDAGGTARLEYVPDAGAPVLATSGTVAWVDTITAGGRTLTWARGLSADTRAAFAGGTFLNGAGVAWTGPRAVVGQLGTPAGPASHAALASLGLADARTVPVLITR